MSHLTIAQDTILRDYIIVDGDNLGVKAAWLAGNDAEVARLMNVKQAPYKVDRESITAAEVWPLFTYSEYITASAAARDWIRGILGNGQVNFKDANIRTGFQTIFANGTATRTALVNYQQRTASKCETLLGAGVEVDQDDVSLMRTLP